ncbi:MAG: TonB-dependent receptor [Oceanospirillaceae bacterium]|nr:TonB-dependent receptor [Oceanospirillaceae bacterium]
MIMISIKLFGINYCLLRFNLKLPSIHYPTISLLLLSSLSVQAQQSSLIDTLVVSATGYEQDITQAPASISVIDRSKLENRAYKDLTDALRDVPGVIVTGGGSRQDISMRGMPAKYTAILVDGKKQSGRESQPNGSGGFEQDWLPPLGAIERIEVIRGPMSTLYGSDALGGVINIITRKDSRTWQGSVRTEVIAQDNAESGSQYQAQFQVSGPLIVDKLNLSLSGLVQERKEDDIERAYGGKELASYRGSLHFTPTDKDLLTLEFTKHQQQRVATKGKTIPDTIRNVSSETNNNRHSVSLSHSGDYKDFKTQSFVQSESVENEGRDITINNLTLNTQFSKNLGDHYVTIGGGFIKERLNDTDSNEGSASKISTEQWSLYAEDEWLITDDFSFTYALRLENSDQFNMHLSPRVYGVWSVDDSWTVKTGVSTGYSAPSMRETSASWIADSRGGDIYGNPGLSPETSINKEVGIYYADANGLSSNITFFHNDFKNKLSVTDCPIATCRVSNVRYNINIDKAATQGIEVSASKDFGDKFSMDAAFTYTDSEQQSGDNKGLPLAKVPLRLLTVNAHWEVNAKVASWMRMSYRSEESEVTSVGSRSIVAPATTFVDVGGSWQASKNSKVMLGIYNLFDEETNYDDYGYVEDGRRYALVLEVSF